MKTVVARREKTVAQVLNQSANQLRKAAKQGRAGAPHLSRLAGLREAMREVPNPGGPTTDVARWCMEEDL